MKFDPQDWHIIEILLGLIASIVIIAIVRSEKAYGRARRRLPDLLTTDRLRGRDLLQKLRKEGISISGPAFYFVANELVKEGKALKFDTFDDSGERTSRFRLPLTEKEVSEYTKDLDMKVQEGSEAFERMLPELLLEYPGEYVAIRNGQVIAHMTDEMRLAGLMTGMSRQQGFITIGHVVQRPRESIKVFS